MSSKKPGAAGGIAAPAVRRAPAMLADEGRSPLAQMLAVQSAVTLQRGPGSAGIEAAP